MISLIHSIYKLTGYGQSPYLSRISTLLTNHPFPSTSILSKYDKLSQTLLLTLTNVRVLISLCIQFDFITHRRRSTVKVNFISIQIMSTSTNDNIILVGERRGEKKRREEEEKEEEEEEEE